MDKSQQIDNTTAATQKTGDRTTFDDQESYRLNRRVKFPEDNTKYAVIASHMPAFDELIRFTSLAALQFMTAMANGVILPDDYSVKDDQLLSSSTIIPDLVKNIDATIKITKPMLELFPGETLREQFASFLNTSRAYMVNCINQFSEEHLSSGKDMRWVLKVLATGKNSTRLDEFMDKNYSLDKFPFPLTTVQIGEWVDISPFQRSDDGELDIDNTGQKLGHVDRAEIEGFYKNHAVFNKRVEESANKIRIESRASTYLNIVSEARAAQKKIESGEEEDTNTQTAIERLEVMRVDNVRRVREQILSMITDSVDTREVDMVMDYLRSPEFPEHVSQRRKLFMDTVKEEAEDSVEATEYLNMIDDAAGFIGAVEDDYGTF